MITVATGPLIGPDGVTFVLPDPDRALSRVWLCQELRRPRLGPTMRRLPAGGDGWALAWRRGGVDRMEYLFRVERAGGESAVVADPGNPLTAAGAFGARSVVEFPGYRRPSWLRPDGDGDGVGTLAALKLPRPAALGDLPAKVWAPPGTAQGDRLPLLVVHDGLDYAAYASLPRCLGWAVAAGLLPPLRAALLGIPDRDEHYSASLSYAAAFAGEILPALLAALPTPRGQAALAGMGASLGALALLHVQRTAGAPFGGLYLQSGSFFLDRDRRTEGGFRRFDRVRSFVASVLAERDHAGPRIPVALTCGLVEENLAGNRSVAGALRAQGHPVALAARRDAHNWVAWRDTFEPHLVPFLATLWGRGGTRR
jgi:enterochelin esterase-like enzyme